ncbi:hypothetical protein [Bacteroides helcogenes]|uniref:Xaa-Pro dipeptidyl-peptidase n=1 Tax=Bacteroides helcogenes (strain ATCC 35417 / DSM 20613 / JCM 6297 / CCUG 15421 / P 36-108) TaxID=693979 RepID=E6SUC1_BACT6|nr:hypothetical protein [Bacteroides helcogenes]ADV42339.1 Xaa-Pro dipeptidyl-peptidase [Bacteroides helcogenes P 36-108]MDY5237205.1 hypothetical protein [Bacteroides helcogenes]
MKAVDKAFGYIPSEYPKEGKFSGFVATMVQRKVAETQNIAAEEDKEDELINALKGFAERNRK